MQGQPASQGSGTKVELPTFNEVHNLSSSGVGNLPGQRRRTESGRRVEKKN